VHFLVIVAPLPSSLRFLYRPQEGYDPYIKTA
jgi:hypothetical protein